MAIKENFLRDAKIGNNVELMIGSKEMVGLVVSLDMDTVKLRRNDGKEAVLALDSISYYELDNNSVFNFAQEDEIQDIKQEESITEQIAQNQSISNSNPNQIESITSEEKSETISIVESQPPSKSLNLVEAAMGKLVEKGDTFFASMKAPVVKGIKEVSKETDELSLKLEINAISDSLDYAINKNHEISPADYKIQENIGKIRRLIRNNPLSKTPSNLLGALYFKCKCDRLALESYEDGDDNEAGFAIAESLHNDDKKLFFAVRHFAYDRSANAYIYRFLLNQMIHTDDYSLCEKILVKNLTNSKLHAYHSFIRVILHANDIEYNEMLDFDITGASLEDLLKILRSKSIGSKTDMVGILPTKKDTVDSRYVAQDNRTLEECPVFASAEKARQEEKDIEKAKNLYIKAIENNEKPGSAVANLCQIFLAQKQYDKCAKYLGRYGSKYMRENAYDNLKKQLFSVAPKMRKEVDKYKKNETNTVDYFTLAQKAELEEKDLQKAMMYYKQSIEARRNPSAAVPNLASIYSRLEMYSEALELLNRHGDSAMEKISCLNLKINILMKAKDKKYKREIEETFDQMEKSSYISLERKTEMATMKANLLLQIEEYDEAIKTYNDCLNRCNDPKFSSEKRNSQKIIVLRGLCNAYIYKNDIAKGRQYAREIITINPDNEFAKSILSGNISEELEIFDENIGVVHINEYIKNRIKELSLDSELKAKNHIDKKGVFTGSQELAARILSNIKDPWERSVNEEANSNRYLVGAKLINQVLDRNEEINEEKFNESRYLYYIAVGTCSYANSRLYRNDLTDNFDIARYFYIQPITIFNESEQMQLCWAVATVRYIQTYFEPLDIIRREGNNIYGKIRDYNELINVIQKIMQKEIRTEIDVYTIGMIELLIYNTKIRENVLASINASPFQGKILDVLAKILGTEVPDISSVTDFEDVWESATRAYYAQRKEFLRQISETIESLFVVGQLQENFEKLKRNSFNNFLNNTDRDYINNLYDIFLNIARYNEIGEFDYKADTLKRADDARKILEEKIHEYPTYLAYEKLLEHLEKIQGKILKESVLLYGDSEPQISIALSGDCSFEKDKMLVRVPIAYTNRANAQNADNIQMRVWGDGVENTEDTMLSRELWIGDGIVRERMLVFKVSDKVLQEQMFSIQITITYQYKKNMTEIVDGSADVVLSVPLYSESIFKPIENKFKIISGGDPVHDKSMFYGRDKDIASIISQIKNASLDSMSGKCLVLYGQTRTGKSSILHHIQVQLREQGEENIIINMESPGKLRLYGNNITEFLYKMLRTLNKEITRYHNELAFAIKEHGIEIDAKSLLDNPEQSQLRFNEIFDDVYEVIKEQDTPYHIVLMIDEFTYIYDWIRQGTMTDRIMKFWKAFMQTHNVFAIIIGQDHMMQFMADHRFTNDFGIMETMKVSYLAKDDAQRLMDEPILYENDNGERISRYKEGALDRLYELTSGSAFLIGKLCAGLVEYLNDTHSVFITRAHIDDYIKKMLPCFDEINFDSQYKDHSEIGENSAIIERNKEILKRIAQYSNKKEYTPIEAVIQSEGDRDILDKLEQRDVVIISNGDRCKIKVALYKEWLIAKYGMR